jgi:hypothetical protein
MSVIDSGLLFEIGAVLMLAGKVSRLLQRIWKGQLALGSDGAFCPESLSCPGIGTGIFFIFARTSVPESKERFVRRTMRATAVKKKKSLCFPLSKATMTPRSVESACTYKPREHHRKGKYKI